MESTKPIDGAILLSGGIDSTALAYMLRPKYAITVDYGQMPAVAEVTASRAVCSALGIIHEVVNVDCSALGAGSMLMQQPERVNNHLDSLAPTPEWWPFRNQLIITFAAARAVALGIAELVIGTVKSDRQHSDGQPEFVDLVGRLIRLQEGRLSIRAPALDMETVDLVRLSKIPISVLAWSHSCHTSVYSCGICRGCLKHQWVFDQLRGHFSSFDVSACKD